ncbi:type II toxin-antitoxin system VapC family toxin [Halorussus sp. AFM4]|uniref:type II toxin-antitoxin system VapC family toxin n=1 Tax=Halorussus sp. AFM4 TaxID=3421651 RepID=UPI003EBB5481
MKLLDTNVLAKWGNPAAKDEVVPYLQTHAEEQFVTSSLVLFEFFRPAKRRQNGQQVRTWLGKVLDGIEPFDESAGLKAASVEANLRKQDKTLQMRDLLIASHASDLGATFVTYDKGDFENRFVQQLLDVDVIRS